MIVDSANGIAITRRDSTHAFVHLIGDRRLGINDWPLFTSLAQTYYLVVTYDETSSCSWSLRPVWSLAKSAGVELDIAAASMRARDLAKLWIFTSS